MKRFSMYVMTVYLISSYHILYSSEETQYECDEYNNFNDSLVERLEKDCIEFGYDINGEAIASAKSVLVKKDINKASSVVGFVSFFINKNNFHELKPHDGYINRFLVAYNTEQKGINLLLDTAVGHLKAHLNAKRAAVLYLSEQVDTNSKVYVAVTNSGFVAQKQIPFEKEKQIIRYEKSL